MPRPHEHLAVVLAREVRREEVRAREVKLPPRDHLEKDRERAREGKRDHLDVIVDRDSLRPVLIESTGESGGLEGMRLRGWRRAGDVRLATRREDIAATAGASPRPFTIPAPWRHRVSLAPSPVPANGTVVVVSDLAAHADVEPNLFVPSVTGRGAP